MLELFQNLFSSSEKSITAAELEDILAKKKITLLDVREPNEYRGGHIKSARNFPLQDIHTYQGKKAEPVYVICQSGMRSKRAASVLSQKGYEAINIKGGMMSYKGKTI